MNNMTNLLTGVIMGVVSYIVVNELMEAFELGAGEEVGAGEELLVTLVPIAIAVMVIMIAFRGMSNRF